MTPDDFGRIRRIYESAIAITGTARETYLREACRDLPALRQQVDRLIQARDQVPAWLEKAALIQGLDLAAMVPALEGRILGGYTLSREIGRGGMGTVYLAERSDGTFRKRVAVKLVLPPANNADIISRFQQEREILASLDHPNIAHIIDGGTTGEGWPYFVMEYVEGLPIHRWCDERKLDVRQRIELFAAVLAPVRYAHQRLVAHLDLKPGNILVTRDGTVKLLDFGIAKVISPGSVIESGAKSAGPRMTPEYASPEQLRGEPVTTLTDVYSLGVLLHELLTGDRPQRPYNPGDPAGKEIDVTGPEPVAPGKALTMARHDEGSGLTENARPEVDARRLKSELAGDVVSILQKAMQPKAEDRYGSVESFAEDLKRHLEYRPVSTRQATPWYLFSRFCRRNRTIALTSVLLGVSVLSGLVAVVWQARRSLQEAQQHPDAGVFLGPVWVIFYGSVIVLFSIAFYFARPTTQRIMGVSAGGLAWTAALWTKYWIGDSLGWWHSRVTSTRDPLGLFTLSIWPGYDFAAMSMLLFLYMTGRRYGWKAEISFLVFLSFFVELRERVWFSVIVPALSYSSSPWPILGSSALIGAGGAAGLMIMRMIANRTVK